MEKEEVCIKKERQSNFELLRIISMFFIVLGHYISHSGIMDLSSVECTNRYIAYFITPLANIGVNCFLLISGYFLINSKFKIKNIIRLIFETFFYSVVIMLIYYFLGIKDISLKEIFLNSFSYIYGLYWFITAYIVLYILFPFINRMLDIDRNKHKLFIIVALVIFTIIPTFTLSLVLKNRIMYFIVLYAIGAYIKKYGVPKIFEKKYIALVLFVVIYVLSCTISMFTEKMNINFVWLEPDSILLIFCSVMLFIYFTQLKIQKNIFINKIAATTLSIYLIHEHPFNRDYIWTNILHANNYYYSNYYLFVVIVSSIIVFIVCSIIELIRKKIFTYIKFSKLDKYYSKIDDMFNN